jgi:hypothetical protein
MIPIYSAIDQTDQLPLVDQSLLYINPGEIIFTYDNVSDYVQTLSREVRRNLYLNYAFKESICQPRFNLFNHYYKIELNRKINIFPDFKTVLKTEDLFDKRAIELFEYSKKYDKTYVFWSGGIDSTLILCSILKNWNSIKDLIVVLNQKSIDENPLMYEQYIKNKLTTVDTDLFFNKTIKFSHNNVYVSGELGDPLITFDGYGRFKKQYHDILDCSWKTNIQKIIDYFNSEHGINNGTYAARCVIESFSQADIHPVTVHDFLWWINFNWGWDVDLYLFLWSYHDIDYPLDMKTFVENNMFFYFNSVECQNWAVNLIGSKMTNYNGISKYPFKKYIYDFNNDSDYFKYKEKEFSTIKNKQMLQNKKIMAVDTDFTLYYRKDFVLNPYY